MDGPLRYVWSFTYACDIQQSGKEKNLQRICVTRYELLNSLVPLYFSRKEISSDTGGECGDLQNKIKKKNIIFSMVGTELDHYHSGTISKFVDILLKENRSVKI